MGVSWSAEAEIEAKKQHLVWPREIGHSHYSPGSPLTCIRARHDGDEATNESKSGTAHWLWGQLRQDETRQEPLKPRRSLPPSTSLHSPLRSVIPWLVSLCCSRSLICLSFLGQRSIYNYYDLPPAFRSPQLLIILFSNSKSWRCIAALHACVCY